MSVLDRIRCPADLRALDRRSLCQLAKEIRAFLVDTVTGSGGHLGPNLGVVELTLAVHRVFDSPADPIVWDTGHQAYVHKLLTGRKAEFARLRALGGLSGYPNRTESEHDVMENSHASTALSYADGLAKAMKLRGESDRTVVAVVGDGAMTGGMCWEALQNITSAMSLVIVLNDNGRSYAPTTGGFAAHLADLRNGSVGSGTIFEHLGLRYLGPVDGHDLDELDDVLRRARDLRGPVVVHCVTHKGQGHPAAEHHEADRMHAIGPAGRPGTAGGPKWTDEFEAELVRLAEKHPDLVGVSAAMVRPVGFASFAARFPDRVFDVGIAEQHAVTTAAGLALGGLHPVVAVYSTFFTRAVDQALLDVAMHRLPVTFVLDRAGITGEDGPSHHGMWDLTLAGLIPGLRVAAPRDGSTLRAALRTAIAVRDGPTMLRFPKGSSSPPIPASGRFGRLDVLRHGDDVLVVSVGAMAARSLGLARRLATHGITAAVVDPRWVLPIEPELAELAVRYPLIAVVEDAVGGAVAGALRQRMQHRRAPRVLSLALPTRFVHAGSREHLLDAAGLSPEGMTAQVVAAFGGHASPDDPVAPTLEDLWSSHGAPR